MQHSSHEPFPDSLDRRRSEDWYGSRPVTLTRDGVSIEGGRQGRFGGVIVHRPERDIDFGPDRTHRVWNHGMFAELDDEEWERMGWTITRPQANPTNPILVEFRRALSASKDRHESAQHYLQYLDGDVWDWKYLDEATKTHAREVISRLSSLWKAS